MTDQEKSNELLALIDNLCSSDFSKEESNMDTWIQKLNKVYANGYRHTYSDIFYKVQTIISNSDSEVLETLGENLNVLGKRISAQLLQNTDDANLQNTAISYKKFSDHIKLEIGRYNFIKTQFNCKTGTSETVSHTINMYPDDIKQINDKIDKLTKAVNIVRPIATEAQRQMDKLDDKLESNKISSITTLTIFSAVVLAFSGGITFEAGIFKGMVESTPYRLVFTIALTGFILFNTIFMLLYLVGKMAGKKISTICKYMTTDQDSINSNRKCGDGYCHKECSSVNFICKILHKYSYVFAINATLLWIMYADFILWLNNEAAYTFTIFAWQALPAIIALLGFLVYFISQKIQENRIKLQFKVNLINKIVNSQDEEESVIQSISRALINALGVRSKDLSDALLAAIEKEKIVSDKDYRKLLKKVDNFVNREIIKNNRLCTTISYRTHNQNKKEWKSLKSDFRNFLSDSPKI